MSAPLGRLLFFSLLTGEWMGWLALFLSPEIARGLLFLIPGGALALFTLRVRLGDRLLFPALGLTVGSVALLAYFGNFTIATLVSGGLLLVHAQLWLSREAGAYRFWRLGVAFLETLFAAILSPETHMFLLIFFFALVSALSLSFGFLERRLGKDTPVPARFVGAISLLSFLVFLSSLVIFPLLPRSSALAVGRQWAEPGFTETVDLNSSLNWGEPDSRPQLWFFLPQGAGWGDVIPHGLIRGATMDIFEGNRWRAGLRPILTNEMGESPAGRQWRLSVFRDSIASSILPVPYGAFDLELGGRERARYQSGEWVANAQFRRRVQYEVLVADAILRDPPKPSQKEIPSEKNFSEVHRLAREYVRGRDEAARIRRVSEHFRAFRWKLVPMKGAGKGGKHPVETFLTETKEGHCELFASSAALIFRAMGMPARLVAGFRVRPGGSLVVARNTDAHAWVEVWSGGRWVVVDPSPEVDGPAIGFWEEAYDYLNAYWYRYIVGYEFDARELFRALRQPPVYASFGAIFLLWLALRLRRKWRERAPRPARWRVSRAYERLEREWTKRNITGVEDKLRKTYEQLRFGLAEPSPFEVEEFLRGGLELIRRAASR